MKNRLYFKTKFFLALLLPIGCHQLPPPFHKVTPVNKNESGINFIVSIMFLVVFLFKCHRQNDEPASTYRGAMYYYWILILKPEEERKKQCNQANAIAYSGGYYGGIYCISKKVNQGSIYDAYTMQPIINDTISPGQSFICQCGNTFNANSWYRGTKIEDNPTSEVSTSFMFASSPSTGATLNTPLVFNTNYNQKDNLYCVTVCPADTANLQYQFLKIR
jgi:hypothetical protein